MVDNSMECPVDVIFVLDESQSMKEENFELMKQFVSHLVGRLNVDSGETRVGLVCYANHVYTNDAFNLTTHSSLVSVQSAVKNLVYDGGLTNTADALLYVSADMLTAEAGDRPDVPNVVILMADGQSNVNEIEALVCTPAE